MAMPKEAYETKWFTDYQPHEREHIGHVRLRRPSKSGCDELDVYIDASQRELIAILEDWGWRRLKI